MFFTALLVSTSYASLLILGYLGTAVFAAAFCGPFWVHVVGRFLPQIVAFTAVILFNLVLFYMPSNSLRSGNKEVSLPGWWLFYYSLLTAVNMVLGVFLAVTRIALLLLLSLLDISRVDRSLFPYWRSLDSGYQGFYGMVLL